MPSTKIRTAFPFLFGVSIYDDRKIPTEDGASYYLKELDASALGWSWYAHATKKECVRAVCLDYPLRLLGAPVGKGSASLHIKAGEYTVTDGQRIWGMSPDEFQHSYL